MRSHRHLPSAKMQDVSTESAATASPFFPDNLQFWYETKRAFGCASYGGSEFGEVLATVSQILSGDFTAGPTNGMRPASE